ncbi:MAG TPA: rhodanese-like domain-containing protein [Ignavibacteriaceae bacterium]|nr:rhodanese-like domain-containing protein [Ignavibacteriaceae bacterium]
MIKNLSPFEVNEMIKAGEKLRLIDVREQWERDIVKLEDSYHMPLSDFLKFVKDISLEDKNVVYCHHGSRSLSVCNYLIKNGFKEVINLRGGIHLWSIAVDPALPRY